MSDLASFIKFQRKRQGFTQQELAEKAGVGLRFIRDLEQGKETLQLDKVNQLIGMFGFSLAPVKQTMDPYTIFWNYFNQAVKLTLITREVKYGIIIKEILTGGEITAWKFVSNNNAIRYQQKPDNALTETILHASIVNIEKQE